VSIPHYVTTSRGQVRLFLAGDGAPVLVLAGPTRSAAAVADELAEQLPGRGVVAVEPPGTGGSARLPLADLDSAGAAIVESLAFLAGTATPVVALDLAAVHASAVAAALGSERVVLVGAEDAEGWVAHDTVPPSPVPEEDGRHLTAYWAFLRDRRLVRADAPTLPRTSGPPLPGVAELSDGFVAAVTAPAAFERWWVLAAAALRASLASLPHAVRVSTLAGVSGALAEEAPRGALAPPPTSAAPATDLWHQYVATARGRVHLRRAGSQGRPVLVLSTGGGSSAQFAPVVQGLAEGGRMVASMDYLGNGLSDHPDRRPDVPELARDALAGADALGWDELDVWGSHTGACVALEMAVTAPDRIGRAVLEAPVMMSSEFRDDIFAHYFPDLAPDAFGSHVPRVWNWRRDAFLYWPWYRVDHAAGREIGLPSAADLHLYAVGILESGTTYDGAYRAGFGYDTRSALPHLRRPAILTAGPHDMLANALDDAADLVPDGLLETVPTPATVWWPAPAPEAARQTLKIYREFLG
jgi:pimeloyl-ACP methyl ester carboxylesterase